MPKDIHLKHLDLFSGAGLFGLAARWAGLETLAFSEIDPYANTVLHKQFPATRNLGDIRKLCRRAYECDWLDEETAWCPLCNEEFGECACIGTDQFADDFGYPDVITAGFPCQDVSCNSHTGSGTDGARSGLVFEAFRVTEQLRPTFLLLENVPALKSRGYDALHAHLAAIGYTCEPFVVGAHAIGGAHRRKRVWVVAYDPLQRIQGLRPERFTLAHTLAPPLLPLRRGDGQWEVEPDLRRAPDGHARWMDRLKVIGNAVVPQIPVMFFDFMREVLERQRCQSTEADPSGENAQTHAVASSLSVCL